MDLGFPIIVRESAVEQKMSVHMAIEESMEAQ
jgi:hypothetical protein